jgi:hypothetical protein
MVTATVFGHSKTRMKNGDSHHFRNVQHREVTGTEAAVPAHRLAGTGFAKGRMINGG